MNKRQNARLEQKVAAHEIQPVFHGHKNRPDHAIKRGEATVDKHVKGKRLNAGLEDFLGPKGQTPKRPLSQRPLCGNFSRDEKGNIIKLGATE